MHLGAVLYCNYMMPDTGYDWVQRAKTRGLGGTLGTILDALEPLGPLGAQVLWVIQPAMGLFGARDMVREIAEALEEPGGIDRIRQQLEE